MQYNKQNLRYGSYEEILASYHDPINGRALCCAHRSYWRMYPENSVPAILAAIEYGNDVVELDVRTTLDHVCVLSHDNNLGRCTNAPVEIASKGIDQIEYEKIKDLKLKFGTGGSSAMVSEETICRFDTALLLCEGKILINLDKVMEDDNLRESAYNTMLGLYKQGHNPFEYCMFKLGKHNAQDTLAWIREKEEKDGVKINYIPWGMAGANAYMALGYKPLMFEFGYNYTNTLIEEKTRKKVGYFANTFEGSGWDDPEHWTYLLEAGANAIHTDEGDLCPKIIRRFYAEKWLSENGTLLCYSGPCGDMKIPDDIETVSDKAFADHDDLRSITVGKNVKKIGAKAFENCPVLKHAVLSAKVKNIAKNAFAKDVILYAPADSYTAKFAAKNGYKFVVLDAKNYEFEIYKDRIILLKYLGKEKDVTIPETIIGLPVFEIGRNCFEGKPLESVTLQNNTDMIEQEAFKNCKKLRKIVFEKPIKSISITAFDGTLRHLTFVCAYGSYPFRFAQAKGIRRSCPDGAPIKKAPFKGAGTDADPYIIASKKDLLAFSKILKEDPYAQYATSTYSLTADIKFDPKKDNNFDPIGSSDGIFGGIFKGNGHTVSGIRIHQQIEGAALFGVTSGAEIYDVNCDDVVIGAQGSVGGFIAIANNTIIKNCRATNFDLSATKTYQVDMAGFAGSITRSTVIGCSAVGGKITGARDLGGFASDAIHSKFYQCYADQIEDLVATGNSNGGFIANFKGGTYCENCYTTVSVKGALRTGAFSGYSGANYRAGMKNCFAAGKVEGTRDTHGGLTGANVPNVVNCYYRAELENVDCRQGTPVEAGDWKKSELLEKLGAAYKHGKNHPVLKK